jgi:hypothetical protein
MIPGITALLAELREDINDGLPDLFLEDAMDAWMEAAFEDDDPPDPPFVTVLPD